MQRIRETDKGLQFTQDTDIVTFTSDTKGDVRVYVKESILRDRDDSRKFVVEGRDNIRDFGEWLTRIAAQDTDEPTPSSFDTYTVDSRTWVAAVSTVPAERGVGLGEFMNGNHEGLGTDTIEDLSAFIDVVGEAIGRSTRDLTRVEREVFAYPFGIPEGMSPMLLATQTSDRLQLQFDELFIHGSMPFASAQKLGAWSLQGIDEIQKKAGIWG